MKTCKISYQNNPKLSELTYRYHLDYPQPGVGDFKNLLAGWVAIKDPKEKVSIIVRNANQIDTEHPLNIERTDVIEKVVRKHTNDATQLKCGFAIPIDLSGIHQISIKIGDNLFLWFNLEITQKKDSSLNGLTKALKKNSFEFSFYQNFAKGQIGDIYQLCKEQQIIEIAKFWQKASELEYLELEHPEISGLTTRARASVRITWANYIIFSDSNDQNYWVMVQLLDIIDVIITPEKIFSFSLPLDFLCLEINRLALEIEKLKLRDFDSSKFSGFTLNQTRPFHFFYDQLKWLYFLTKNIQNPRKIKICNNSEYAFFTPDFLEHTIASDSHLLAYPTIINRNAIINGDTGASTPLAYAEWHTELTEEFERAIYNYAEPFPKPDIPAHDLVLWIGISTERRCWVEQVTGYSNIINTLTTHYNKILVFVDGLTATYGKTQNYPKDNLVIKDIAQRTSPSATTIVNLSGSDYLTKIKFAQLIDFFITDAGTTSIVPLRFCKKPGVLHSNKNLFTFPGKYPETIQILDKSLVEEDKSTINLPLAAQRSYHIHWQHIYNAACRVLTKISNIKPTTLDIPSQQQYESNDFEIIKDTINQINPTPPLPSILKSLAFMFEKKNDLTTARKLVIEALRQDHSNTEAVEMEREYRKKIGNQLYKPGPQKLIEI